jgi:tRNA uridine 5-carboxymethylaminomethyl modification enzyme
VTYASLIPDAQVSPEVAAQVEIQAKYEGYIERQKREIERRREFESLSLPSDFDYRAVRGLSFEAQHKLAQHRPETIGQASRISGITPAAISLLLVHLKRGLRPSQKKTA